MPVSDLPPAEPLPDDVESRIYDIHLELRGTRREAAVQQLLESHPQLRDRIAGTLAYLEATDVTLAAAQLAREGSAGAVTGYAEGARIGQYALQRLLGRGGFGEVWLAEQSDPIRRRVALKILTTDLDDAQSHARFERERDTLALLQHENVARVFDAGRTDDGRPFLVMELLQGEPLIDYCDRRRLATDVRLRLFLQVCSGVQHTHQKGVLHRDLKPSNILVTEVDGVAVPKIIDFGVAKAVHGELIDRAGMTEGRNLLGTPEYMSPEQAEGADLDTRADVYSLGVLLFELLTGVLPLESRQLRRDGIRGVARLLREFDVPPPSSALEATDNAHDLAARRSTNVSTLLDTLRGDLDWVVRRATAPDREQRYASVSALAEDVERAQRHEPIVARPFSRSYVFRKFVRRHRAGVTVAATIVVSTLATLVALAWGLIQVTAARNEAVAQRNAATASAYESGIAAASLALARGDAVSARRALTAAPAEHRHWEWEYLHSRLDDSVAAFDMGFLIHDVAVHPVDGRLFVAGRNGTIRALAEHGEAIADLRAGGNQVHRIALDPAGRRLAAVTDQGELELFDVEAARRIRTIELTPSRELRAVSFAGDGRFVLAGGDSGDLFVLEAPFDAVAHRLPIVHVVTSIAASPDGTRCAIGASDGSVYAWRVGDWTQQATRAAHHGSVSAVEYSRDGRSLFSASVSGEIAAWTEPASGDPPVWRQRVPSRVLSIASAPDDSALAVAGGFIDSYLGLLDPRDGAAISRLHGDELGVHAVSWMPAGDALVAGGRDAHVRRFEDPTGESSRRLECGTGTLDVALDDAEDRLYACARDGTLACWRLSDLSALWRVRTSRPLHTVVRVDAGPITADWSGAVSRWDPDNGNLLAQRDLEDGTVMAMCVVPGAECLATITDGTLWVLDPSSLATMHQAIDIETNRPRIAVDRSGTRIAVACSGGSVSVYETREWQRIASFELEGALGDAYPCFAPDRDELAIGSADGSIRLVDFRTGLVRRMMNAHVGPIRAMSFTNDGQRLVSAGEDERVRIHDSHRLVQLAALEGPEAAVYDVEFTADGGTLFACSSVFTAPGTVHCWRTSAARSSR